MATRRQHPFLTRWQPEGKTLFFPYGNQKAGKRAIKGRKREVKGKINRPVLFKEP
jgi:hypothetical protein